ncbi:hypothetical protein E4U59_000166, partial [Claviceps monticola]
ILLSPEKFVSAERVKTCSRVERWTVAHRPQGAFMVRDILKENSQKEGPMADYWGKTGQEEWHAEDGQLTHRGRLVAPDVNNLRTRLIAEVHQGRNKTIGVLKD